MHLIGKSLSLAKTTPGAVPADSGAVVQDYYTALAALNAAAVSRCYAADVHYETPQRTLSGHHNVTTFWANFCRQLGRGGTALWNVRLLRLSRDIRYAHARYELEYRRDRFAASTRIVSDDDFVFNRAGDIVNHQQNIDFWSLARAI
ncbi:MAG: nuclear transport factor 2 family protein [Betaproteobacteria bacterium]|nr:nuclear transport factor 2 family protein [Betaproteobacteria bacterium]